MTRQYRDPDARQVGDVCRSGGIYDGWQELSLLKMVPAMRWAAYLAAKHHCVKFDGGPMNRDLLMAILEDPVMELGGWVKESNMPLSGKLEEMDNLLEAFKPGVSDDVIRKNMARLSEMEWIGRCIEFQHMRQHGYYEPPHRIEFSLFGGKECTDERHPYRPQSCVARRRCRTMTDFRNAENEKVYFAPGSRRTVYVKFETGAFFGGWHSANTPTDLKQEILSFGASRLSTCDEDSTWGLRVLGETLHWTELNVSRWGKAMDLLKRGHPSLFVPEPPVCWGP